MTSKLDAAEDATLAEATRRWSPMPEIDLRQLVQLSDDTGLFQHAIYGLPDPNHGYCIDDNVRALIASLLFARLRGYDERVAPMQRYLTFVVYAWNDPAGAFRNFMSYDRRWLEDEGSQDSQGRAIWGLGLTAKLGPTQVMRELARDLLNKALPSIERFTFIRSWAFAMLGLDAMLHAEPSHDYALELLTQGAEKLYDQWTSRRAALGEAFADWPWWEDEVTYDNAKLSHALMLAGYRLGRPEMIEAALESLDWLVRVQTSPDGRLSIIGNDGWFTRAGHRAQFDQQPLEAYAMVHACLAAAALTNDAKWANRAWMSFQWFRGENDLGVSMYHPETGGCQDGLTPTGVNKNQGAESSLAYLLSVLELHRFRQRQQGPIDEIETDQLGYAIASASSFARFCLKQYRSVAGVAPHAVWNRTASKARQLALEESLEAYDDLESLVRDAHVDIVHVAGTPATHAEQALLALAAGRHVLCEKPIATSRVDAQQMIDAARRRDVQLAVNLCMRYSPLYEPMKQLCESKPLGALLRGYVTNRAGDSGLGPDHWFWDRNQSGGVFVEHGVHFFDLLNAWLGKGRVISAYESRRPGSDCIDQAGCEVRYNEQAVVNFYHGFHQADCFDQQDYRLIFERGEVTLRGWTPAEIDVHAALDEEAIAAVEALLPDAHELTLHAFTGDERQIKRRGAVDRVDRIVHLHWEDPDDKQTIYGRALRALMQDFVETIRRPSRPMRVTADDALAALDLALEAQRLASA